MNRAYFSMMAAYNQWANQKLYAASAALSSDEFTRDCGAFFRSMCGTLNHILVADRIWMKRFCGTGQAPNQLDEILHLTLSDLLIAREAEDERIIAWIDSNDEDSLKGRFSYTPISSMRTVSQRISPALTHMFNHQTHHRGQAHMILSVLGYETPEMDLSFFLRTPFGMHHA